MRPSSTALVLGLRSLRRRPGYSAMVALCLGAGLAVSLGAGGLTRRVLLDPLPFADADHLVVVHRASESAGAGGVSFGTFSDLAGAGLFEEIAAAVVPTFDRSIVLREGEYPEKVPGLRVTSGFFETLGVRPALGRTFQRGPEEEPEAMLSHAAWRTRWGGAPDVVGSTIRIGDQAVRVAGVLPRGFAYDIQPSAELFLSFTPTPQMATEYDFRIYQVVGRTGATVASLAERLKPLDAAIRRVAPWADAPPLQVAPIREHFYGDVKRPLLFLAIAGALTLLVATVNVGLLLMARAQDRRESDAVRVAFGASRSALMWTPVAEALLLGAAGALLGLLGASALVQSFAALAPDLVPTEGIRLDPWTIAAALIVAFLATGAAAAAIALRARSEPGALRSRGGSQDRSTLRRWNTLVAAQSALVAFLLVAAGLTARSLDRLLDVDPGFEAVETWTLEFALPDRYDSLERIAAYVPRAERQLRAQPAIDAAGFVSNLPLSPGWWGELAIRDREGGPVSAHVDWERASPGYFDAMGIPLVAGRGFHDTDDADAPLVTVVNERLARQYWPNGGAVGERISGTGEAGPWLEVVGVVGDVRQDGLALPVEPMMYIYHAQFVPSRSGQLVVRAAPGAGATAARAARSTLLEIEPATVISGLRPLDDVIRQDTRESRLQSALLALFATAALLLGLAGLFGVVSYAVGKRRRDIGIRMAIGSSRLGVAGRILRSGLGPVAAGIAAGLALALLAGSQLRHLLFGVSPADPLVLIALPLLLLAAATIALLGPAIHAARTDPARVLRGE